MRPDLTQWLACPQTKQPLREASPEERTQLTSRLQSGQLIDRRGQAVKGSFDTFLIREDGRRIFLVEDGVPRLLPDDGIDVSSP